MMQTHMLIFSDHCAVLEAGEDLMFVAWFITRKDLRGKGIGGMVIRKCIDSFTPETKIALHAAWGVRDYYASLGFKNRGLVTFTCEGKFEKLIQGKRCDNIEIKELIECNFQDVEHVPIFWRLSKILNFPRFWRIFQNFGNYSKHGK